MPTNQILLAVSGGIDSMTMVDLFMKGNLNFAIAHVNHNLRNDESLEDAHFIAQFCLKNNIKFHQMTISKDTFESGNMHAIARGIRYEWFGQLCETFQYDYVATAHHQDDGVETFFLNLLRGSGIEGLGGIHTKVKNIIRPLMFATKEDILQYAKLNNITYREDSSNATDKYTRNKIRQQLIPTINEIDARAIKSIPKTLENIKNSSILLTALLKYVEKDFLTVDGLDMVIDIHRVKSFEFSVELLYRLITPFGFNESQVLNILDIKHYGHTEYLSQNYMATFKDKNLVIFPIKKQTVQNYHKVIQVPETISFSNFSVTFKYIENQSSIDFTKNDQYICLDEIDTPLILRSWQFGDVFKPYGMGGKKQKISDFLINQKVSNDQKQHVLVLESKNEILCILHFRTSERVKITRESKLILQISFTPI